MLSTNGLAADGSVDDEAGGEKSGSEPNPEDRGETTVSWHKELYVSELFRGRGRSV